MRKLVLGATAVAVVLMSAVPAMAGNRPPGNDQGPPGCEPSQQHAEEVRPAAAASRRAATCVSVAAFMHDRDCTKPVPVPGPPGPPGSPGAPARPELLAHREATGRPARPAQPVRRALPGPPGAAWSARSAATPKVCVSRRARSRIHLPVTFRGQRSGSSRTSLPTAAC